MQNYEELFTAAQPVQKALKDAAASATRVQKNMQKSLDTGNLAEAKKNLAALKDISAALEGGIAEAESQLAAFDTRDYFVSGDFTRQLLDALAKQNLDVKGEKGVYEVFPFKVRVLGDEEHAEEIYLDRKKVYSYRPEYIADMIGRNRAKLYSASFNAMSFMNELADAYETARLRTDARKGSNIALAKVYKYMAPTARARKEYDAQAFAFDLARLYELGPDNWVTKSGDRFDFGTSRNGSGYRVLSRTGLETYISTVRALQTAEE